MGQLVKDSAVMSAIFQDDPLKPDEDTIVVSIAQKHSFQADGRDDSWTFKKPNVMIGARTNIPDRDIETEIQKTADDLAKINGVSVPMEEVLDIMTSARDHFNQRIPGIIYEKIYAASDLQPKVLLNQVDYGQKVKLIKCSRTKKCLAVGHAERESGEVS